MPRFTVAPMPRPTAVPTTAVPSSVPIPSPTAATAVEVVVDSSILLNGVDAEAFNKDEVAKEAFKEVVVATVSVVESVDQITEVVAKTSERRRLQGASAQVDYTLVVQRVYTGAATDVSESEAADLAATIATDVKTDVTEAATSGTLADTLAGVATSSAALANAAVDVAGTTTAVAEKTTAMAVILTQPPTLQPILEDDADWSLNISKKAAKNIAMSLVIILVVVVALSCLCLIAAFVFIPGCVCYGVWQCTRKRDSAPQTFEMAKADYAYALTVPQDQSSSSYSV